MMRFIVTFKAETAMLPYVVEADELQIVQAEGVALFLRTNPSRTRQRRVPVSLPLRFIAAIDPVGSEVLTALASALYQQALTV